MAAATQVLARPAAGPVRILGLDPGSVRTGFGIIDCDGTAQRHVASGCIRPPSNNMALRLRYIYDAQANCEMASAAIAVAISGISPPSMV